MRRIAFATLVAVSVLLLGALPAAAAVTATIQSPAEGQEITTPTDAQVRIQRDPLFDPEVDAVALRLVRDGTPTSAAGLTCVQGCGSGDQTWGQLVIDPRSPDVFEIDHPLANGTWTVQTRWQDSDGTWSTWGGDVNVTLSVAPSAITGLSAAADLLDVTLTWTRAPEPDVSAYRVQRRPDGGAWQNVTSTDASASSYEDTTPSAGTYEYRVVTVRPAGDDGVLTATSSSVSVTTTSSGSSSSDDGTDPSTSDDGGSTPDDTTSDRGSTSDDTTDDGGTSGSSDDPSSTEAAAGTDEGGGDGDSSSARSRGGARVAPPPGVRQRSSLDVDADLPQPEVAPQERFYGEGEGFSEELDYGDAQAIGPDGAEDGSTALQRMPGGVQEFIVSRFETGTLLRSIAAGLLFVALGLHAFRWMHATPND